MANKASLKSRILIAVLFLAALSTTAWAYSGGTGDPNDPYLIADANDMQAIGANDADWGAHFKMVNDVNLAQFTGTEFNIIGNNVNAFTGTFDGNDHTISNFTYSSTGTNYIGLFGYVGSGGQIKDLALVNTNVDAGTGRFVGGLVGRNWYGTISNCYATGPVTGDASVGGLVGSNSGTISNCYACGVVSGTSNFGGFAGVNTERICASFWDTESSGQANGVGYGSAIGVSGKTTAEMHTMSTFLGWGSEPTVWTIDDGNDYPHLASENKPGVPISPLLSDLLQGTGTQEDPYLIYTDNELNLVGLFSYEWDRHFKLMADIDLSGYAGTEFNIIGNDANAFTGVFDGNGHTISNFTYTSQSTDYVGLFGDVNDPCAEIKSLRLLDPNINSENGDYVGALVGWLSAGAVTDCNSVGGSVTGGSSSQVGGLVGLNALGTVSNCYATCSVTGSYDVAGLVGYNNASISNCYATGNVAGDRDVGGLAGRNFGTISNCCATGSVSGGGEVGGLVGGGPVGNISNCYATGSVSGLQDVGGLVGRNGWADIFASFWDTQTSGQANGVGSAPSGIVEVYGRTTAEMKTQSTFTDYGWDFATPVWTIQETLDYPRLWWDEARTIFVDGSAQGANNGTSWQDAYTYLQDALADANSDPDRNDIWVAAGIYTPDESNAVPDGTGLRTDTFQLISRVGLYGGFPSGGDPNWNDRDPNTNETMLSGDLNGDDGPGQREDYLENSYHVVTGSGTDASAVLDGFTVRGGNCTVAQLEAAGGGGIFNLSGSPTLNNCKITESYAFAVYGGGGGTLNLTNSNPTVSNCTFFGNWDDSQFSGGAGGIANYDNCNPRVTNCAFSDNYGGGMGNYSSSPTVTNCTFSDNGGLSGGGIGNWNNSNPIVTNCTFMGNYYPGIGCGGGMLNNASSPTVTNCIFSGNSADFGSGMYNDDSDPNVTNCVFSGHYSTEGPGMYSVGPKIPWIMNCIFWGNTAYTGSQIYGSAVVSYSDVQGGWAGAGGNNINEDPLFMDADGCDDIAGTEDDNLRLLPGSPCIDGGNNIAVPADIADLDNDGNTTERTPLDLDYGERFWDDPCTPDSGVPDPPAYPNVVDMGAYEYRYPADACWDQAQCAGQPYGDATCDGNVNFPDLGALKVSFFKCKGEPGYNCCTDFNQDGSVNFLDLGILKVNFFTTGYQPSTGNQNCPP